MRYWIIEFENTAEGNATKHTMGGAPNGTPFPVSIHYI